MIIAVAMDEANATASAVMLAVAVVMEIARVFCVEGNCIGNVAAAAMTAASTMAVKAAAR